MSHRSTVVLLASLLTVASAPAAAWDPTLPQHPTTFPVNTGLTEGPVSNMFEMYADPYTLNSQLKPARTFEPPKLRPTVRIARDRFVISDKIQFETGSATVLPASFELLDTIAEALNGHPRVQRVTVEGHTDDVGEDDFNLDLSQQRADAVRAALVTRGVAEERLEAIGKGETDPLEEGVSEDARAANRRVEFMIAERSKADGEGELREALGRGIDAAEVRRQLREERRKRLALPKTGDLPVRNEFTSYADVTISGISVGRIGPLTTAVFKEVPAGFYEVELKLQNGFQRTFEVRTEAIERGPAQGGPEARAALDAGEVYSWHDDPTRGHSPPPPAVD